MSEASAVVDISVTEERLPPYDPSHGTPDAMVRRVATIRLGAGGARFEQTDYGHPGRLNPWEPRSIDAALQPRTEPLRAVCDALGRVLGG